MSTQSVYNHTYSSVSDSIDKSIACAANNIMRSARFGIKDNTSDKDLFKLQFYKRLMNDRYCSEEFKECFLEKISRTINKI